MSSSWILQKHQIRIVQQHTYPWCCKFLDRSYFLIREKVVVDKHAWVKVHDLFPGWSNVQGWVMSSVLTR